MFKFEELKVWKKSVEVLSQLDDAVKRIPAKHQFLLGEQLRRSGLSISANIAEACGRFSKKEENYFFNVAKGSGYETVSLLFVSKKKGFIQPKEFEKLYNELEAISKMLSGLLKR